MQKINLKDEYPWYSDNEYIEVPDEVAEAIKNFKRREKTQAEVIRYHRAFYSLDVGDGIEKSILYVSSSPDELYERKLTQQELYSAIKHLSEKQAKRIYARFFQDMTVTQIAQVEGVDESSVRESISGGLKKIEQILKKL